MKRSTLLKGLLVVVVLLVAVMDLSSSAANAQDSYTDIYCAFGRVRKDVKSLSTIEKEAVVDAIHALKAAPSPYDSRYTYYDQFVRWHQLAVMEAKNAGFGVAHANPAFPPWHRKLLWLYENALCEVSGDPELALPYWDWTDPASTAALFSVDLMGPGGDPSQGYAVTEGPFRREIWQLNLLPYDPTLRVETPEKYLVRALGVDTGSTYRIRLPTIVDVNETLARTTYDTAPWSVNSNDSFRNTLEGFVIDPATGQVNPHLQSMHNIVHDWVGGIFLLDAPATIAPGQYTAIGQGTMEPLDVSPNDPIFFLHHANVDRVWASWQVGHPGSEAYAPQGGDEEACIGDDDPGPEQAFPKMSDLDHLRMSAANTDQEPKRGMRLDDAMYPYCLPRYADTIVAWDLTPYSQLDTEILGYDYEDYYLMPPQ